MKKYFYTPVLVMLLTSLMTVRAQNRQEYLGLPGDNLNLFAVMKLFQESETLEGFERNLNDPESRINNLDLDEDGYVDYIRVLDNIERDVHYIVLQVAVSPRETQDIAVFTVIRESNGNVIIQLIGDEALYGRDYIIEPIFEETANPGYMGSRKVNGHRVNVVTTNTYQIATWPIVRVMFMPTYVIWHSPWYYNYYPSYWRPWNPFYWHYYYGYHSNYYSYYYGHYRHWNEYRYDHWHDSYYNHHRTYSPVVASRISQGNYNKTYSRPEQRREGVESYRRTQQAGNVTTGGRRSATDGNTNQTSGYGPRKSTSTNTTTRQSTGASRSTSTNQSRQTTTSGSGRRATTTGTTRETTTKSTENSGTRQSGTTTSGTPVKRTTSGNTTRQQSATTNTQSRPASTEKRSTATRNSQTTRSTSGTSVNSSGQSKSSGTSSGRRTSSSKSSGGSARTSEKSDNSGSSRQSGRR
jgi:hypothetical protein